MRADPSWRASRERPGGHASEGLTRGGVVPARPKAVPLSGIGGLARLPDPAAFAKTWRQRYVVECTALPPRGAAVIRGSCRKWLPLRI